MIKPTLEKLIWKYNLNKFTYSSLFNRIGVKFSSSKGKSKEADVGGKKIKYRPLGNDRLSMHPQLELVLREREEINKSKGIYTTPFETKSQQNKNFINKISKLKSIGKEDEIYIRNGIDHLKLNQIQIIDIISNVYNLKMSDEVNPNFRKEIVISLLVNNRNIIVDLPIDLFTSFLNTLFKYVNVNKKEGNSEMTSKDINIRDTIESLNIILTDIIRGNLSNIQTYKLCNNTNLINYLELLDKHYKQNLLEKDAETLINYFMSKNKSFNFPEKISLVYLLTFLFEPVLKDKNKLFDLIKFPFFLLINEMRKNTENSLTNTDMFKMISVMVYFKSLTEENKSDWEKVVYLVTSNMVDFLKSPDCFQKIIHYAAEENLTYFNLSTLDNFYLKLKDLLSRGISETPKFLQVIDFLLFLRTFKKFETDEEFKSFITNTIEEFKSANTLNEEDIDKLKQLTSKLE